MARILKTLGLGLLIATIVWLVTLWRWHNDARDIEMADIVVQLILLPLVLTLGLLSALWVVKRLRQPAADPAPALEARASMAPQDDALSAEAAALRNASAWMLTEAVTLPIGADVDMAWAAMQASAIRPDLDAELRDMDGLPVFSARAPHIDLDDWLSVHADLLRPDEAGLPPSVLRALALIEAPLHHALNALSILRTDLEQARDERDGGEAEAAMEGKAHLSGVARPMGAAQRLRQAALRPSVTIRVLWPLHWQAVHRERATAWLQAQCEALHVWATQVNALEPLWQVQALSHPEAVWAEVDQQLLHWARDARPALMLVLAVDSAIDADRVDHLQAIGSLFTAANQTGLVPGEGAAAILLAHPDWPQLRSQVPDATRLWRPISARRDKSADAAGRTGCRELSEVFTQAMQRSAPPHAHVMVVADADHRASRTGELFETLQTVAPDLDPISQVARVGEACGDLGMARALVPTALAGAALRHSDHAQALALATHVHSSHERVVVALSPMPPLPPLSEAA